MIALVLAGFSATMYGISDFLGGIFSKSVSPWRVAAVGQTSSTLVTAVMAAGMSLAGSGGSATGADFLWAMFAGLGSGIGAAFLYRGLARAKMNVVAPISAVGCALLPVAVGFGLGDRPGLLAVVGIIVAFPAIWLVAQTTDNDPSHSGGVLDGVFAGIGFGLMLAALAQVDPDAGMWPVVSMYVVSALSVAVIALILGHGLMPRNRTELRPLLLGLVGAPAALAFYYATHYGLLSIVSVITSLYPAVTVILAAIILRERVIRTQGIGLAMAVVAVVFVAW